MKIIIVGNGKIGYALAKQLSEENHDLVLVDSNAQALSRAENALDVLCMKGNGASIRVLLDAGARTADLVIAVTNYDEVNIVCCLIAKKLGAQHTVARIRNPDYFKDAPLLKKEVGLDLIINPEAAAAQEIARILRLPSAFSVESFAGGRVDLIGFTILESDALRGRSLREGNPLGSANTLLCVARRGEEVIIPDGNFTPQVDDRVYVVGSQSALNELFLTLGRRVARIKTVSVVGGGRITVYLGWALAKLGMKLRIVEQDHEKCAMLSELLPHALILEGDGTDRRLLEEESIFESDAFVSLTGRDEENLLMGMNARRAGVGSVLVKMTRPNYTELLREMGVDSVINPKEITANKICRYVRAMRSGSGVEMLYRLLDGAVEAVEFTASAQLPFLNLPLSALALKKGLLIAALVREGKTLIPDGNARILAGDRVIVIAHAQALQDLSDIIEK